MSNSKGGAAAKGPDNNKELARLQGSVSTLAMALAANGVDVPEGSDPIALAIASVKRAAELEQPAAEHKRLADHLLTGEIEEGSAVDNAIRLIDRARGGATEGEIAAIARADAAEARVAELQTALEAAANGDDADAIAALEDQIDELERAGMVKDARIKDLEAGAPVNVVAEAAPEPAPEPEPAVRPERAADVGPDYPVLTTQEILELASDGAGFEIAASNGEYEILAINRVELVGATDLVVSDRLIVSPPIFVTLAATDAAEELHGFGLLHEGVQVGYCPLLDKIKLEPGTQRRFDRSIYF